MSTETRTHEPLNHRDLTLSINQYEKWCFSQATLDQQQWGKRRKPHSAQIEAEIDKPHDSQYCNVGYFISSILSFSNSLTYALVLRNLGFIQCSRYEEAAAS